MTTVNLSVVPNSIEMRIAGNTAASQSPFNSSTQRTDRGAAFWQASASFINFTGARRAELMAFIAEMRSQSNSVRLPVFDNPKNGAYGGTPLVDGGSQTGTSINIKGASFSVADWIKRGDYFSIDVNGEHELKIATADASSSGGGLVTVSFQPTLRASPLDSAAIYVEDGVLTRPQGVFFFSEAVNGWSSRPGSTDKVSNSTLSFVEDIFATQ